jgi:hypothetical protein
VTGGGTVVRASFLGANDVIPEGTGTLEHQTHYLHGSDPTQWVIDVPNHKRVVYMDLWDGIDLEFRFEGGQFKYEFHIAPGSDPSSIVMAYEGMDSLEVCGETGDLLVGARGVTLRDHAPVTYQPDRGTLVTVASEFHLLGDERVTFLLGDYDRRLPVIIDPGMLFSTFLGEGGNDAGNDVAVDGDGHIYVAGLTTSSKFPVTAGAYDNSLSSTDAFVSKFSTNGTSLEYSTFIGGTQDENGTGVAVDTDGLVHLTGTTNSTDFPTTTGAFCTTLSGYTDAFALRLNITGSSLDYSTFVGGRGPEKAMAMDLDAKGSIYVAGWTSNLDFPEVNGSFENNGRNTDSFVVKVKPDGTDLEYSCVLGGEYDDNVTSLVVDDYGCAYITGDTVSTDYPITQLAYNPKAPSVDEVKDVFVTKLSATGSYLVYSTYVGHIWDDVGTGIDVDAEGCAYVVGNTSSGRFPTHPPKIPYPSDYRSHPDTFILKLSANGHDLDYSKVLNITYRDGALAVSVDAEERAIVAGYMDGRGNFNTTYNAFQSQAYSGEMEAYVLMVDDHGDEVVYASFLGGNKKDSANAIAMDGDDLVYLTGWTYSTQGFPTTPGAYDNTSDASTGADTSGDAFLCKLDICVPYLVNDSSNKTGTTGEPITFNLTVADNVGVTEVGVQFWFGTEANSTNLTLNLTWGDSKNGSWTGTVDVPSNSLAVLFYRVWANDTSGLNATIREYSILVIDNDLPVLDNLTPASGGTGNQLNLSVRVVDNVAVDKVGALYSPGGLINMDTDWWTQAVFSTGQDGDIYNFTITLSRFSTDPFQYRFYANDTSGNWLMTEVFEIKVVDDDRPVITVDPLPVEVTTGQDVDIRIYVRDNLGVTSVRFTWWYDVVNGTNGETLPMAPGSVDLLGNGVYAITFRVPFDTVPLSIPPIGISFWATDTSGNNRTSRTFWMVLRDDDLPWFQEDLSSGKATTGDPFNISVRVWDNVALDGVWVHYWFGRQRATDLLLVQTGGNTWNATISVPNAWTALHYYFGATDSTGNINWSARVDLQVEDNDAPQVIDDETDGGATTGDPLTFKVHVTDNLFVVLVRVVYWMGDGERKALELIGEGLDSGRNGTYQVTMDAPSNASGPLTYVIEATDAAANVLTTEERHLEVRDNDLPWFGNDLSDEEAWRGLVFRADIDAWDNVDLDEIWCEWWFGEGEHMNASVPLDNTLAIGIPLDPGGPLGFLFAARDAAGNWNSTGTLGRQIMNRPPTIEGLEEWNVTEEELEVLDLRPLIVDLDDTAWVLSLISPNPNVTLEAYSLSAMHDTWVYNYVIEISVSDGWDITWHNITVRVMAINDPPWIHEVTHNGKPFDNLKDIASFREGSQDVLTVLVTDEEGDVLSYSWQRDGVEVATGSELMYRDLPLGAYDLTLYVSDGTDTTNYQLTVSVTEEEEPVPPWILIVAGLVLLLLTVYIIKGSDRDEE